MKPCCAAPDLTMGWRLGYEDEAHESLVMLFEMIECKNCGGSYVFDDKDGTDCPHVALYDNKSAGAFRVKLRKAWVA